MDNWIISCHRNTQRDTYTDEEKIYKVQRQLVQDDLEQKTSDALTTETKKQLSRNQGKVQ
jgi:hypothetical protein